MLKLLKLKTCQGTFPFTVLLFPQAYIHQPSNKSEGRGNIKLLCSLVFGEQGSKIKTYIYIYICDIYIYISQKVENCSHRADVEYSITGLACKLIMSHRELLFQLGN